jgi:hypothetical protein
MKTILIIFAGMAKHKWHPAYDYYMSLYNNILAPLMPFYNIYISIGCEKEYVDDWNIELIQKLPPEIKAVIHILEPVNYSETSAFTADRCTHPDRELCVRNHSKLYYTFHKTMEYMNNLEIDFIFNLRFDLFYNPDEIFDPIWLLNIPDKTILVSSTEFHMPDRWKERVNSIWPTWPNVMCNQMLLGRKDVMTVYFNFFKYNGPIADKSYGIESILANYIVYNDIDCLTFDMQFSQPGGPKFTLGNGGWLPKRENCLR